MNAPPSRHNPLYATPPMTIGKHEWRLIVYPYYSGGNVTEYQWRRGDEFGLPEAFRDTWHADRDWPRYDINDGMYAGLPRTLVRLYERHRDEIKAALEGIPWQSPQADLFASPDPSHRAQFQQRDDTEGLDR
jgi:hypothetical protein